MAKSGIDGHRPGGAEAGGRKEVFRHRWRTRSTKGRRRARRPEAGRGRGGERCGAVAMQAAHNRQPATASGAARAAATACAITEGPPVRPGRVPCARCGRAATARRRSRGVGRLTRARPTTAGRRAAASPRTRGRGRQDDRVHVRAICAIVSRRDCWMCRGPLLAPVVARTLRGSEGKSGRCSCERSPATAPRGPLTWESQGTYRMSSAPFCVGRPPAGRSRAGLARLDGESPGSTGRRGISIRSRCRIPSARVRRGCCRPRRGGTSRTSCRWPPSS